MKPLLTILMTLCVSTIGISQNNVSISQLESSKNTLIKRIEILKDSLQVINQEILKIKSEKILSKSENKSIIATVRPISFIISEPSIHGDVVMKIEEEIEVKVIGYENTHYEICAGEICGFIFRSSIRQTDEMKELRYAYEREEKKRKADEHYEDIKNKVAEQKIEDSKMLKKYGKSNFESMKEGKFWIGMNQEMILYTLGEPKDTNETVGAWGKHEQWVYDNGLYLYFENGKLTSYQL
jgi:hypothetical protein